jgi:hypothetical protein
MVTREELYALVWSMPMSKLAAQFNVSGSYMARVCTILRVPRPERGYWAKLQAGRSPKQPPLPNARMGDQLTWSSEDGSSISFAEKTTLPAQRKSRPQRARIIGTHSLIQGARKHFESGRPVEDGQYLKPYKKLLVDVTASKSSLERALAFANDLFNALESAGHRVALAPNIGGFRCAQIDKDEHPKKQRHPNRDYHSHSRDTYFHGLWNPGTPTVAYVGEIAIGLAVLEMSDSVLMRYVNGKYIPDAEYVAPKASRHYVDHTWTTTKDLPIGRLRLIAYSPYHHVTWSKSWQESKASLLKEAIPSIVKAMEIAAVELIAKKQEADRQSELARLQWEQEYEKSLRREDRNKVHEAAKASRQQLDQIIQAWSEAVTVGRFLQGIEEHARKLPDDKRCEILERLELARKFIGTQSPLDFFLAWKTPTERYLPKYPGSKFDADESES